MTTKHKTQPLPKIQRVTHHIGKVYKTKYGDVEVLSYLNNIFTIRFISTGYTCETRKDPLEKGNIRDPIRRRLDIDEKRLKIKDNKKKLKENEKLLKTQEKELAKAMTEARMLARKQLAESKRERKLQDLYYSLIGRIYEHPYFGEYQVICYDKSKGKTPLKVKFLLSGYECWKMRRHVINLTVIDDSRKDESDFKLIAIMKSAKSYLKHRERSLAQSKQWQKDNPDKCRVRNQNRRAKRFELGGEVTLEELNALMEAQDHKCANCKDELTDDNKHMDHIMPVVLKGTGDIKNIQWLCDYCNLSKNDKHPDLWAKVVATKEWWDIKELRQKEANNQNV